MPQRIQLLDLVDFSGGLKLRSDAFQLGNSDSPDLLNVDVDPIGGFSSRRGITAWSLSSPQAIVEGDSAKQYVAASSQVSTAPDHNDWSINTTNALTVEFWWRPSTVGAVQGLVAKSSAAQQEWFIRMSAAGAIEVDISKLDGTGNMVALTASTNCVAGVWHHVAVVMTNTAATIYLNGTQVGTKAHSVVLANGTAFLYVGEYAITPVYANGWIDEVAVYSTALDLATIQSHYAAFANSHDTTRTQYTALITASTPKGYWHMSGATFETDVMGGGAGKQLSHSAAPVTKSSAASGTLLQWLSVGQTPQVIVGDSTSDLWQSTGSNGWTKISSRTWGATVHGALYKDPTAATTASNLYLQDGTGAAYRYNGSTATALTATFNEDYAAANQGDMPRARLIAAHMGRMWVAYTTEGGVDFPNRVRFSHPNQPEDWRTNDYIDIDIGSDAETITGFCALGERLLVFKTHSVYAIVGFDQSSFNVVPISRDVGASSQEAIACTEDACYFWDRDKGLFELKIRASSPEWIFEPLGPSLMDGDIPAAYSALSTVNVVGRRVYASVPWDGSTTPNRSFVYDPTLRKRNKVGPFVFHDFGVNRAIMFQPSSGVLNLATVYGTGWVMQLEANMDEALDRFGWSTSQDFDYETTFITSWFDLGSPAIIKKWRRPQVVMDGASDVRLLVSVWIEYDPSNVTRSFYIQPDALSGVEGVWDSGLWDTAVWAGSAGVSRQSIERGQSLGRARSVRLGFTGPNDGTKWSVNAISLKYVPRRVRS